MGGRPRVVAGRGVGWRVTWFDFHVHTGHGLPAGRIANPYRLCAWFRVEPERSTVELRLGYANTHDPVY